MKVTVNDIASRLDLELVWADSRQGVRDISIAEVARPGLELSGFFDYSVSNRVQLLGRKEIAYIETLEYSVVIERLSRLLNHNTPMIIVTQNLDIPKAVLEAAKASNVSLFKTTMVTSRLIGTMYSMLDSKLAERTSIHGVLMDIYGLGILIQGESGIGKSETALELIRAGHQLVADDRVDVYKRSEISLVGEAPKILHRMLEIRGVGLIDVVDLFGTRAIHDSMKIDLSIYLQHDTQDAVFDRLGNGVESVKIAGVEIPRITIPVRTGRTISVVIETAAMNFRAKSMGLNATEKFNNNLTQLIAKNSVNN